MSKSDAIAAVAALQRLREDIAVDREAMRRHVTDVGEILAMWATEPPTRPYLVVAAVALHAWYNAIEKIFERVAREIDKEIPSGEGWHRSLLSQATIELRGLRPPVVARTLQHDLSEILSFRHFFRHAYAVDLEPEKLRIELARLMRVEATIENDLDRFAMFLGDAADALAG